jgi:hypothetical protein
MDKTKGIQPCEERKWLKENSGYWNMLTGEVIRQTAKRVYKRRNELDTSHRLQTVEDRGQRTYFVAEKKNCTGYGGNGGIASRILNLGIGWRSVSLNLQPLYIRGNSPETCWLRRHVGQNRSGCNDSEEGNPCLCQ